MPAISISELSSPVVAPFQASHLNTRASKSLFSLFRAALKLSFPDPSLLCYLFDALVRPMELLSSRTRSCTQTFLLGVPRTATSYGELAYRSKGRYH